MPTATITRHHRTAPPPPTPAGRRVAIGWALVAVVFLIVALASGLVFAFTGSAAHSPDMPEPVLPTVSLQVGTDATDEQRQDALAAAPMTTLLPAAANPHALLPSPAGEIFALPTPTTTYGLVPTGFPRTAEGAVAQLAAIDETAISGMNPSQVAQVYADWALAGADPLTLWSVQQFVSRTLTASGIPDGSSQLQATYTVTEAQVKGTVGADFVLACVNGEFDASLVDNTVRVGAADCARMVWTGTRWQIGPGTQPATPPDAWPGTAEAAEAGWRPITDA